jgi:AcrR family transcriptional regulator
MSTHPTIEYSNRYTQWFVTVKRLLYQPLMTRTPTAQQRGPKPTKHNDILWAAAKLFAERGVGQTSTRDIAAAAKTTERTLYKHFGTKEALVRAVVDDAVLSHIAPASLQDLRQLIESHGDDIVAWHMTLLRQRSDVMAKSPHLAQLLLVEILRDETLRQQFGEQWLRTTWTPLITLFKRLKREGQLKTDLPADTAARAFLSLNLGYLIARYILAPKNTWDDAAEHEALARLFSDGASARPHGAHRRRK